MEIGFKNLAQRQINAENAFIETLMELGNISKEDAAKVCAYYLREKLAKMDSVNGTIRVKHGIFLDGGTIRQAAKM